MSFAKAFPKTTVWFVVFGSGPLSDGAGGYLFLVTILSLDEKINLRNLRSLIPLVAV